MADDLAGQRRAQILDGRVVAVSIRLWQGRLPLVGLVLEMVVLRLVEQNDTFAPDGAARRGAILGQTTVAGTRGGLGRHRTLSDGRSYLFRAAHRRPVFCKRSTNASTRLWIGLGLLDDAPNDIL